MTGRGWWCLFVFVTMLLVGIFRDVPGLIASGMALLLWFAWEWLFFTLRTRRLVGKLHLRRELHDERAVVTTLWQGRTYRVRVELHVDGTGRLPYVAIADPVPFGVQHEEGRTTADGELEQKTPITIEYIVHCPLAGVARFEGMRIEVTDLQGFFCHVGFVRAPLMYRILPGVLAHRGGGPTVKRHNQLMPPGIHRLKQPGSGSELLDLRDYVPGDPPRTIAWKVSARRDRLITKEFESEVPVRCTLFLDVSSSVLIPSPASSQREGHGGDVAFFRPVDRLVELAAGVIRANATLRDLTGLCLFDERDAQMVRPQRGTNHQMNLLRLLGEAAARGPMASRADPNALLPIAYAFAQEVYPELLRDEVNSMPGWINWIVGFPRYTRHRRGPIDVLHRSKRSIFWWGTTILPLGILVANIVLAMTGAAPEWSRSLLGGLLFFGVPCLVIGAWLLLLFSIVFSHNYRKRGRWRKRLAALFCARALLAAGENSATPVPVTGTIDTLLENDDLFSLHLQQFLAEHQVPCAVPLHDEKGRYLFALPEKVTVLARALVQAVNRGRDNELFVLLADLLELDEHLEPLLQAVRVALGRHHQVLLICPWPQDVPLPHEKNPRREPRTDTLPGLMLSLTHSWLHVAFGRIRRAFARLGVQVVCAGSDESVPLILDRIERVRSARRVPGATP